VLIAAKKERSRNDTYLQLPSIATARDNWIRTISRADPKEGTHGPHTNNQKHKNEQTHNKNRQSNEQSIKQPKT